MVDAITVEFDEAVQSLDALNAAAYRLLDAASCQIEKSGGKFVCRLTPKNSAKQDGDSIRLRFIDCVTDENVRERLAVASRRRSSGTATPAWIAGRRLNT
jgi:hypothetical protein